MRTYVSAAAEEYKNWVWGFGKANGVRPLSGPVSVSAVFYFPNKRGDLDNRIKVLLDALQDVHYADDKQVHYLEATRRIDKANPRVEVEIVRFKP